MNVARVAVVGAGVTGLLVARELTLRGIAVSVHEALPEHGDGSASRVAAAMLAPLAEAVHGGAAIGRVGLRALPAWRDILGELGGGVAHGFDGTVVACRRGDEPELHELYDRLRRIVPELAGTPAPRVTELSAAELAQLEPDLSESCVKALLLEPEGWLDGQTLLQELVQWLRARGARVLFDDPAERIDPRRIRTRSGIHDVDVVVDARGIGALQTQRELRGVRGELCRLEAPGVRLQRPVRVLHPRYPIYVVPRPHGQYLVGATSLETPARSGVSVTSALELLTAAYSLSRGFRQAAIVGLAADARPAYPDHLPRIRRQPGLVAVNGVYRHGYLLGPALACAAAAAALHPLELPPLQWPELAAWPELIAWCEERVA